MEPFPSNLFFHYFQVLQLIELLPFAVPWSWKTDDFEKRETCHVDVVEIYVLIRNGSWTWPKNVESALLYDLYRIS